MVYEQKSQESAGTHNYTIPINANAGIFVVRACIGNNCYTQKMVKYAEE